MRETLVPHQIFYNIYEFVEQPPDGLVVNHLDGRVCDTRSKLLCCGIVQKYCINNIVTLSTHYSPSVLWGKPYHPLLQSCKTDEIYYYREYNILSAYGTPTLATC